MLDTSTISQFPSLPALTSGLNSLLNSNGTRYGDVTVIEREQMEEGSFPKELVTCRVEDGRCLQLFCKYTAGYSHSSHGHRGGVPYEAQVYHHVLRPLRVSTPSFHGMHRGADQHDVWFVLEYIPNALRLNQPEDPDMAMVVAASWLGRFHAQVAKRMPSPSVVCTYDAEYYRGWSRRTVEYARDSGLDLSWLRPLCAKYDEIAPQILSTETTVIHGEFYPRNILVRDYQIFPVDWESAAIAAGEIDLVTMTDCWDDELTARCATAYQIARWPQGVDAKFCQRLTWARVYLQFRWLGDCGRADWHCADCRTVSNGFAESGPPVDKEAVWRLEELRQAGEQLGLIL
jgi:hypothetical protein